MDQILLRMHHTVCMAPAQPNDVKHVFGFWGHTTKLDYALLIAIRKTDKLFNKSSTTI
jgi:hypothetical protein